MHVSMQDASTVGQSTREALLLVSPHERSCAVVSFERCGDILVGSHIVVPERRRPLIQAKLSETVDQWRAELSYVTVRRPS